jgi:hypothetical protein
MKSNNQGYEACRKLEELGYVYDELNEKWNLRTEEDVETFCYKSFVEKSERFNRYRDDNGLRSTWSIFEVDLESDHPFEQHTLLYYKGCVVNIDGCKWLDLYRVADQVINKSGDHHHLFIEDFFVEDGELTLITGS